MDYSRFFSLAAPNVDCISTWNELKRIRQTEKPVSYEMLYGLPNRETFPFMKAKVTLENEQTFDIDDKVMATLLQYAGQVGYQPLIEHIKVLTERLHDPPLWSERGVVVVNGSLNGMDKIFQMFLNKGDTVFIPMCCYHGVFVVGKHLQPNFVSIQADEEGIVPDSFKEALIKCKDSGGVPKFLYVNPGGSNPTGTVLSESRRRIIYELACQYDILIVEDDPYYYLQFCDDIPASFLRLDTEGRVIRLESFSKTIGAGMRLGFAILPKHIARVLTQMLVSTIMHTSMFSQVLVSRLFDTWGVDGFLRKTGEICEFYRRQRNMSLQAAERHLKGLCEWSIPMGGFFLWLKVSITTFYKNGK
ncbi:kynurenine/alpha-aminoadipate aminotransferase, mitochondrial-like [Palaemon carinicauda]|uniref:kynurenine/alpha-aminoadipate aminotransferase, mitochondrial-like n=1 Tax=Palaemon carinicauda TaxID=392227 RepID=UPI0035B5A6C0